MAELPHQPHLSPQFCFSSGTVRDFLRLSRASIDDSITQNLNALLTPAHAGFNPTSTSQRFSSSSLRVISPHACDSFKDKVLFPAWKARTEVLDYCALVASSPDPNDPDAALREAELRKNQGRVVDERLDPYSGRFFPQEARTEVLAALVRQERGVEDIVRSRTWNVMQQRCESPYHTWGEAMRNCKIKGQLPSGSPGEV